MTNETLIVLCWELYEQGMPKTRIAQRLGKHRETIHLWIKGIKGVGLLGFLDKYKQAKRGERKKRQVDPIVKRRVWGIREREYDCCGQKIQYFLVKEHRVHLSVPKIYEILTEKYVIRSISGRKTNKEAQYPKPLSRDRYYRWIALISENSLLSPRLISSVGKLIFSWYQR